MKITNFLTVICLTFLVCSCQSNKEKELEAMINRGLEVATQQSLLMAKALEKQEGKLPKTVKDNQLETSDYHWWSSGFFPGELWFLYENNPTPELKQYAELYTDRVEPAKNLTNTHDLGFMLYCSFGKGYWLTHNPHYQEVMKIGAESLLTRYNPTVGAIRSWNSDPSHWQFAVIIDNMMNLEFLSFMSRETGDPKYIDIANSHAAKTIEHHFRDDYSSYHVVSYDTISGLPHAKQTAQGFNDASAWARGQAWALYGFSMMARETGKKEYLNQARHIARFVMNHPNLPEDKIPFWDFDATDIPNTPRDASAGAIMASALIDLSHLVNEEEGQTYLDLAIQMLKTLSSPEYLAEIGTNHYFTLKHSVGSLPANSEVDVPLTYADYYYVEALMRLKYLLAGNGSFTERYLYLRQSTIGFQLDVSEEDELKKMINEAEAKVRGEADRKIYTEQKALYNNMSQFIMGFDVNNNNLLGTESMDMLCEQYQKLMTIENAGPPITLMAMMKGDKVSELISVFEMPGEGRMFFDVVFKKPVTEKEWRVMANTITLDNLSLED